MEYSITLLAKMARVTVRAIRHYDEVGLLKPSVRMASGRRIYGDEELMRLMDIVFLKKVGLKLPKIKEILFSKQSNQAVVAALITRKQSLAKEIKRLQRSVTSIEMTLPYYKNATWTHQERLAAFRSLYHTMTEVEGMQIKEIGKEEFEKKQKEFEALSEDQVDELVDRSFKLMKEAVKMVEAGLKPESKEAQEMTKRYYDLLIEYQQVNREVFLKLRDTVRDQKEVYGTYHPKLPEFLYEAMDVFAKTFW